MNLMLCVAEESCGTALTRYGALACLCKVEHTTSPTKYVQVLDCNVYSRYLLQFLWTMAHKLVSQDVVRRKKRTLGLPRKSCCFGVASHETNTGLTSVCFYQALAQIFSAGHQPAPQNRLRTCGVPCWSASSATNMAITSWYSSSILRTVAWKK